MSSSTVIPQRMEHIVILKQIHVEEGEPGPQFIHDANKESLLAVGSLERNIKLITKIS